MSLANSQYQRPWANPFWSDEARRSASSVSRFEVEKRPRDGLSRVGAADLVVGDLVHDQHDVLEHAADARLSATSVPINAMASRRLSVRAFLRSAHQRIRRAHRVVLLVGVIGITVWRRRSQLVPQRGMGVRADIGRLRDAPRVRVRDLVMTAPDATRPRDGAGARRR